MKCYNNKCESINTDIKLNIVFAHCNVYYIMYNYKDSYGEGIMREKRSRSIKSAVEKYLWGKSAGRCEFEGCNKFVGEHEVTKTEGNFGEKAHIEAVSPGGARYKELMLDDELNSSDNIMLLCPGCHKLIDENPDIYTVDILKEMKRKHEERIYKVTEVNDIQKSLMIGYFANIKDYKPSFENSLFNRAVVMNGKVPIDKHITLIGTENVPLNDGTTEFYSIEEMVLNTAKEIKIKPALKVCESISVFALAPMPLLIYLGNLLSDISNVTVYQCHRSGEKWAWKDDKTIVEYTVMTPTKKNSTTVALNISLSADIDQQRIEKVDAGIPTYKLTIDEPNRNFVTTEKIADCFVFKYRECIELIKQDNPEIEMIKVFPAMPNSLAVRMGMDYMPKTDPPMEIYDQVDAERGFVSTLKIGGAI